MWSGSAVAPEGSIDRGKLKHPQAVAGALRQLLSRNEITATRALVAASDAVASFRVLRLPPSTDDAQVDTAVARDLPRDPERLDSRWVEAGTTSDARIVFAAAWDRTLVGNVAEAVRLAGVEPVVVELKATAVARTVAEPACILIDLSSDPVELILIDDFIPQVWHSVPADASADDALDAFLATPLRSLLRFYRASRTSRFRPDSPVYINGEQVVPSLALSRLSEAVDRPVMSLPTPPRVPPEMRHATYLTCLGLMMRRQR